MVQTQHTNAFETTLRLDFGPTALTAEVQSTENAPASPCYLVIEPTNADRREYVLFDGTFTSTQFVTSTVNNRYLMPGSAATSGITHPAGSIVRFAPVAQHFTDHHSDAAPHLATSAATGNRLMLRDAAGRSKVATPDVDADAATKGYVDSTVGTNVARVASGTYTGNGATDRKIVTPFDPKWVYITHGAVGTDAQVHFGTAGAGALGAYIDEESPSTVITNANATRPKNDVGGFLVTGTTSVRSLNYNGRVYDYVAFG